MIASIAALGLLAAAPIGSPARDWYGFDFPGFLHFERGPSNAGRHDGIIVNAGLIPHFDANGDWNTQDADVWFMATFPSGNFEAPARFRWTTGKECPGALDALAAVRDIEMPRPLLPLPDPGDEEGPGIVLDGRSYTLDVNSSAVSGQAAGAMHMQSNLDTGLSKWIDRMIGVLAPCWTRQTPEGASEKAGTASYGMSTG